MRPFITFLLASTVFFGSCLKEPVHSYETNSLTLDYATNDKGFAVLNWTKVNTDDFVQYELYGSTIPIPEIDESGLVDAPLIFSSTNPSQNEFKDSLGMGISIQNKYYKIITRLEQSILSSKQIINSDIDFMPFANNFNGFFIPNPDEKQVVVIRNLSGFSVGSVFNYETKEFLAENVSLSGSSGSLRQGLYQNKKVLYAYFNGSLWIYDLNNLELIDNKTITTTASNLSAIYLKNDYFGSRGFLDGSYKLISYNLNTNTIDTFNPGVTAFPAHRQFNPNYLAYSVTSLGTLRVYDLAGDGKITSYSDINAGSLNLGSLQVTSGNEEYMVNSSGQVFDRYLNVLNFFQNSNTFSFFYRGISPNMKTYAFQVNSTNGGNRIELYRTGTSAPFKSIGLITNFNNFIMDNENYITFNVATIDGENGYLIKRVSLDE